jgi:hypothetical protein
MINLNEKQIDFIRHYVFVVTCCHHVYKHDADDKLFGKKPYSKSFDDYIKKKSIDMGLTEMEFLDCLEILEGHLDD